MLTFAFLSMIILNTLANLNITKFLVLTFATIHNILREGEVY